MRAHFVAVLESYGLGSFDFLIPTPGLLWGIALIAVVALYVRRSSTGGLSVDHALWSAAVVTVAGLLGARAYYLFDSGAIFSGTPGLWIASEGTGSWGVYVGAILAMIVYFRWAGISAWPYMDAGASCAAVATCIGRCACFLAGCDFGRITSLPWSVQFPSGSHAHGAHVAPGLLPPGAPLSLPVHPYQLYLSLNALLVFIAVTVVWRRWRATPGVTLMTWLALYGASRFLWEFLRAPAAGGADGSLSSSQWMCLAMLAVAVAVARVVALRPFRSRVSMQVRDA
jgi:phosphatidylglycerol:prolipoprotein diacylglycerol transferase